MDIKNKSLKKLAPVGFAVLLAASVISCSEAEEPAETIAEGNDVELFEPDENNSYEYTGSECFDSGIEDVVNLGDDLDLEVEIFEDSDSGLSGTSVRCRFSDHENDVEITGEDARYVNLYLDFQVLDRLRSTDRDKEPNTNFDQTSPAAFIDENYSDDEWDSVYLRSWSSVEGDFRFVDLHVQHQHLIINSEMQLIPTTPADGMSDIEPLRETDFDDDIWDDMQQYDDEFQQEIIDFSFEVAENLKESLSKDDERDS